MQAIHHLTPFPTIRRTQGGAATLVVVMLLFFVVSLAAAYASRNLIFEQRTSANQYRYTQGFEAAEAGLEWATAMLNAGRIDDNCQPTTDPLKQTFRQRYLSIETADPTRLGNVVPVMQSAPGADGDTSQWVGCVFNGASWTCSCPQDADLDLSLVAPAPPGIFPAFSVRFRRVAEVEAFEPTAPGVVRIEVNGCAEINADCLLPKRGAGFFYNSCASSVCAMLALHGAAKAAPVAAMTVRGNVSGGMTVANPVVEFDGKRVDGVTIRAGGVISTAGMNLIGVAGTPGDLTIIGDDPTLKSPALPDDSDECRFCLFAAATGLWPAAYRDQPATVRLTCPAECSPSSIATTAELNPGRVLWLRGPFTYTGSADIGSATAPVFLYADGDVNLNSTGTAKIHGVVYTKGNLTLTSGGGVRGSIYVTGDVAGSGGNVEVTYDPNVLRLLRLQSGSFVKVPGSWRDFP